jgi:hypothetical protein
MKQNMSLEQLQRQLIQAARQAEQDDRVPLGFEQRVMKRLRRETSRYGNRLAVISKGLWAACGPAIAMAIIAFFLSQPMSMNREIPADLALENAVLSPLMAENELW